MNVFKRKRQEEQETLSGEASVEVAEDQSSGFSNVVADDLEDEVASAVPGVTEAESRDPVAELRAAIEAICMVSDQPVPAALLAEVLEVSVEKIDELCKELADGYLAEGRGFVLANVAGGWRYQSHVDQAPYVERFVLDGQSAKLSGAALETLAIIAYKQPLSRAQIAAIRGVNVDGVLKTLQQRGYVTELGHDPGPGQATLFGTTPLFLEKLGIASLADLPPLGDFIPGADLVEVLEQGLRPSAAVDLRDGMEDEMEVEPTETTIETVEAIEKRVDATDDEPSTPASQ